MKAKMRVASVAVLAVMMLAIATPAYAFDGIIADGRVVFGTNFTLYSGEVIDGDLVVFGGNVTLEEGSVVEGAAVIWGGNVEVSGSVEGDLVCFGGLVQLTSTASVDGDVATVGGHVDQDSGAYVGGSNITGVPGDVLSFPIPPIVQTFDWPSRFWWPNWWATSLALGLGRVVLMVLIGGLVAVLWPASAARVGTTGVRSLLPSMGVGLLTVIVSFVIFLGLVVTVCLIPVAIIGGFVLLVALIYGWVALGIYVGERMLVAFKARDVAPFWTAALGTGVLTLMSSLVDTGIPCLGWTLSFFVACLGLGAVVLTRFGRVDYPVAPSAALAPVEDAVDEAEYPELEFEESEQVEEAEEPDTPMSTEE
jgi:hypothetical protein